MMDGIKNDLQPDSHILVKFLVLKGSAFNALFEDGGNNLQGHVSCPRVYVVDPSAPSFLHVQKLGNGFLYYNHLHTQNKRDNAVVTTVCESPELFDKKGVNGTIESLKVVFSALFSSFLSNINTILFHVLEVYKRFTKNFHFIKRSCKIDMRWTMKNVWFLVDRG